MPSTKTTPMVVRLPNEIVENIKTDSKKKGVSVSTYLGEILMLQFDREREENMNHLIGRVPRKGNCPICKHQDVSLVQHHWFEDSTYAVGHIRLICRCCNGTLRTRVDNNHIWASWEGQVDYVLNQLSPTIVNGRGIWISPKKKNPIM